jgi:autotransporter passenger strand-loop-strand repeat protein
VLSGGTAGGTQVSSGGALEISSGGAASGAVLSCGGRVFLYSGGSANGTVISNGGRMDADSGGTVSGTTVLSGGVENDYGSALGITVSSGGAEHVLSGAVLSGATISGGLVDIQSGGTAGTSQINFTSAGGTLQLGDSVHFNGVISGFGVPGGIDLRDIAFGVGTTLGFTEAGDNLSGTLTVSDGTHTANITLLGQYVAGNFTKQSDGNGGTLITDPPVQGLGGSPYLGIPHS